MPLSESCSDPECSNSAAHLTFLAIHCLSDCMACVVRSRLSQSTSVEQTHEASRTLSPCLHDFDFFVYAHSFHGQVYCIMRILAHIRKDIPHYTRTCALSPFLSRAHSTLTSFPTGARWSTATRLGSHSPRLDVRHTTWRRLTMRKRFKRISMSKSERLMNKTFSRHRPMNLRNLGGRRQRCHFMMAKDIATFSRASDFKNSCIFEMMSREF